MQKAIFTFCASVEQRDNPALIGRPVIVGAPPTQRGVVCAASYEARKFGVRSAMASITAKRLCPDGCFVRPRMDAYREESSRIMEIIASTGAIVEQMSVDEDSLKVTQLETRSSLHKYRDLRPSRGVEGAKAGTEDATFGSQGNALDGAV